MASQSVATGHDGEGQGDADVSDDDEQVMIAWLEKKRLHVFIESFKQNKITMEDLTAFADDEIEFSHLAKLARPPCTSLMCV